MCRNANRMSQKLSVLWKMLENLPSLCNPLKSPWFQYVINMWVICCKKNRDQSSGGSHTDRKAQLWWQIYTMCGFRCLLIESLVVPEFDCEQEKLILTTVTWTWSISITLLFPCHQIRWDIALNVIQRYRNSHRNWFSSWDHLIVIIVYLLRHFYWLPTTLCFHWQIRKISTFFFRCWKLPYLELYFSWKTYSALSRHF